MSKEDIRGGDSKEPFKNHVLLFKVTLPYGCEVPSFIRKSDGHNDTPMCSIIHNT